MNADALAVRERPGAAARFERFWTWLLSELAPFPGRGAATLRMTIACLVIVTISMALEIPQAYLSAFFVFFMSREDVVTTTMTGIALALALVVGFGVWQDCLWKPRCRSVAGSLARRASSDF